MDIPWYEYGDPVEMARSVRQFIDGARIWRSGFISAYHSLTDLYEREMWSAVFAVNSVDGSGQPTGNAQINTWANHRNREASDNIFKPAIDTLQARLFPEHPRLQVSSLGGDYRAHLLSQRKTWALRSTVGTTAGQDARSQAIKAGLKTGFGGLFPEVIGGQFRLTQVQLDDLWWHPLEARDTKTPDNPPRSLHFSRRLSKGQACAMVKKMDGAGTMIDAIKALPSADRTNSDNSAYETSYDRFFAHSSVTTDSDQVAVVYSWHLPSSIDSGDGVELIQVTSLQGTDPGPDGIPIYSGEWKQETHPIVWWSPYPAHQGLVGLGIGHIAEPYQYQHDISWSRANKLIRRWGNPNVGIPEDLNTADDKRNISGSDTVNFIVIPSMRASGKPYEILTHNPQSEQLMNWLVTNPARLYQALGINEGIMSGQTKLGANASGVALSAEDTRADIRFSDVLVQADKFQIQTGSEALNTLDRATEDDPSFTRRFSDDWGGEFEMSWSELRLDSGAYDVRIEQVGPLGRTAAARIRSIQEIQAAAPEAGDAAMQGAYLHHDLPRISEEVNSDRDFVQWQLYYLALYSTVKEDRADKLSPYWPNEITDFDIGENLSKKALQRAMRLRASNDEIAILTDYRTRIQAERSKLAKEANAQAQALQAAQLPDPAMMGIPGEPMLPDMGGLPDMGEGMPPLQ